MTLEIVPVGLAAKRTMLSEHTLRRRLRSGEIHGMKWGRDWFITREEVERLEREYPLEEANV
jgi:excisionase family DNA binding protein